MMIVTRLRGKGSGNGLFVYLFFVICWHCQRECFFFFFPCLLIYDGGSSQEEGTTVFHQACYFLLAFPQYPGILFYFAGRKGTSLLFVLT